MFDINDDLPPVYAVKVFILLLYLHFFSFSLPANLNYRFIWFFLPALASPVLMSAAKEIPVTEDQEVVVTTQQSSANTDSPVSPVFCTPGIKQILTNTKEHVPSKSSSSNKRTVNVGLFQDDKKKEPVKGVTKKELDVPDLTGRYDDDEPVEPELTYSLEVIDHFINLLI